MYNYLTAEKIYLREGNKREIGNMYDKMLIKFRNALKEYFRDNLISVMLYGSIARAGAKRVLDIDLLIICGDLPKEKLKRQDIFLEIEENDDAEIGLTYIPCRWRLFV